MASSTQKGHLIVVSGASGTGKTTLCRALEKDLGLFFSVSATTRPKRSGEVHGRDYFFLKPEEFAKKVKEGGFLEWAQVYENQYGTPKAPIMERIQKGESVLLDLDTQGALQLKRAYPEAVLIFVKPPSMEVLEKRLRSRGTDSEDVISKRIARAEQELAQSDQYDFVVVNEDLGQAKGEITSLIKSL